MLARLAAALSRFASRWVPDSWVIAAILTLATGAFALAATDSGPQDVLRAWGEGFWRFLAFAMQMCLVVMTGTMVSRAPLVERLLERATGIVRGPRSAVAFLAFTSLLLGWIHWGLSVAASAVLVGVVARRAPRTDYRLLVCSAYLGVATIWHAGLSGSAPAKVASAAHEFSDLIGVIPVTRTIFDPFNLTLSVLVLVGLPLLAAAMHPRPEETVCVDPDAVEPPRPAAQAPEEPSPARWIETSPAVNLALAALAGGYLVIRFAQRGLRGFDLDTLNFAFLFLAVLLHGTPSRFLRAAQESGRYVWGIAIQFPFYAGIAGILSGTGASAVVADAFARFSTAQTYPFVVLVFSGALNYFVPSGGSQWIVSGQYLMEAAARLGVPYEKAIVAYAWGDMSTNLIQPFWAIPLLTVAGLRFRDIMGFTTALFLVYFLFLCVAFLAWGRL